MLERQKVAEEVKGLDQPSRATLRKYGVRFGAYHIYLPALLKPAPRALAAQLWALKHGGPDDKGLDELQRLASSGRTSIPVDKDTPKPLYRTIGYRVCGERAVRVDILERLADLIRPALAWREGATGAKPAGAFDGFGFTVTGAMTSLTGASGEDFASILRSLGYRMDKRPKPPERCEKPRGGRAAAEAAAAADAPTACGRRRRRAARSTRPTLPRPKRRAASRPHAPPTLAPDAGAGCRAAAEAAAEPAAEPLPLAEARRAAAASRRPTRRCAGSRRRAPKPRPRSPRRARDDRGLAARPSGRRAPAPRRRAPRPPPPSRPRRPQPRPPMAQPAGDAPRLRRAGEAQAADATPASRRRAQASATADRGIAAQRHATASKARGRRRRRRRAARRPSEARASGRRPRACRPATIAPPRPGRRGRAATVTATAIAATTIGQTASGLRARSRAARQGARSEFAVRQARWRSRQQLEGNKDAAQLERPSGLDRQRIDKWLWHARVVRTRTRRGGAGRRRPCPRQRRADRRAEPPVRPRRRRHAWRSTATCASSRSRDLPSAAAPPTRRALLYEDLTPPPAPPAEPRPAPATTAPAGRPSASGARSTGCRARRSGLSSDGASRRASACECPFHALRSPSGVLE